MSSDWIETTLSLKKDQILREVEPEVDESRQIDPSKTSYEMCTENGEVVGFILAAGEGGRWQAPQALRHVQAPEQFTGL